MNHSPFARNKDSKRVIELANKWSKKDKRLSWETCLRKARQQARTFGEKHD